MSRAGQFNESRAHQRLAGRAGGFGGGGGQQYPPPGTSLHVKSNFMYDLTTGGELGVGTRLTHFDEQMAIASITDIPQFYRDTEGDHLNFAWIGSAAAGGGFSAVGGFRDYLGEVGYGRRGVVWVNGIIYRVGGIYYEENDENLLRIDVGGPVPDGFVLALKWQESNDKTDEWVGVVRTRRGELRIVDGHEHSLFDLGDTFICDADGEVLHGMEWLERDGIPVHGNRNEYDVVRYQRGPFRSTGEVITQTNLPLLITPEVQAVLDQFDGFEFVEQANGQIVSRGGGKDYWYLPGLGYRKGGVSPPLHCLLFRITTKEYPTDEYPFKSHHVTAVGLCNFGTVSHPFSDAGAGGK